MVDLDKSFDATPVGRVASWDKLLRAESKYKPEDYPPISIVIPTKNTAQLISNTLESVLSQDYPNFEIIVIDSSSDRTLEAIKGYHENKIRIYSVSQCNLYEMLNKGLSQATGQYVNFLFPGDFYIYRETFKCMMILALENNKPQLVYCGTLLRDAAGETKILYRELNLELLRNGQQPTSLQSCWFRADCLRELGKFDPSYKLRGGFELMCRFCLREKHRVASVKRVLTDYDLRAVTRRMVLIHFWETMKTVHRYFGFLATLHWILHQRDIGRFLKLWWHSLKVAFSGSK